jgi:hypothetical protein
MDAVRHVHMRKMNSGDETAAPRVASGVPQGPLTSNDINMKLVMKPGRSERPTRWNLAELILIWKQYNVLQCTKVQTIESKSPIYPSDCDCTFASCPRMMLIYKYYNMLAMELACV